MERPLTPEQVPRVEGKKQKLKPLVPAHRAPPPQCCPERGKGFHSFFLWGWDGVMAIAQISEEKFCTSTFVFLLGT